MIRLTLLNVWTHLHLSLVGPDQVSDCDVCHVRLPSFVRNLVNGGIPEQPQEESASTQVRQNIYRTLSKARRKSACK